jgi:hypothetical protein
MQLQHAPHAQKATERRTPSARPQSTYSGYEQARSSSHRFGCASEAFFSNEKNQVVSETNQQTQSLALDLLRLSLGGLPNPPSEK